jgi:hypothetical protein
MINRIAILICTLPLVACMPNSYIRDQQFAEYRREVAAAADEGKLSPSHAQEGLRDRYREIYGYDQEMQRHYDYAIQLLRGAEQGRYPLEKAQALIDVHYQQLLAERARRKEWESYTDNYE